MYRGKIMIELIMSLMTLHVIFKSAVMLIRLLNI